ncbi:MAG: PDZ domain-containing protein, partial [Actinomycetes bacterium]
AVTYADAIIAGEPVPTSYLGVTIESSTSDRAGARITDVAPGTAAEQAGLRVGDVIISVEGVPVFSQIDLVAQVRAHRPGETVTLHILRNGQEIEIAVTLGMRTEEQS